MEKPDHRVVLDKKDSQPERQELDLNDSIEALLGEIEVSRASIEESKKGRTPKAPEISSDTPVGDRAVHAPVKKPTEEAVEAADDVADDQVQDEPVDGSFVDTVENSDESAVESSTKEDDTDEVTDVSADVDEALDAVAKSAESLLDESIGDLLDEATELVESHSEEPPDSASETEPADEQSDAEAIDDDALISEDVLLEAVAEEVANMEAIVPETVEAETEDVADTNVGVEAVEDLLDSINDELLDQAIDEVAAETPIESVEEAVEDIVENEVEDGAQEQVEEQVDDAVTQVADELIEEPVEAFVDADVDPEVSSDDADTDTVDEVEERKETEDESSDPASASESMLDDLDSALAGMSDDVLMGDFETPDGELVDSSALEAELDPAALLDGLGGIDELIEKASPKATATAKSKPTKTDASDQQPKAKAKLNPQEAVFATAAGDSKGGAKEKAKTNKAVAPVVPEAVRVDSAHPLGGVAGVSTTGMEVESIWQAALRVGKERGIWAFELLKREGGPLAARGVLAMSKPIASKPAQVRDSIGYVALWTLLLATILWMYAMFFRASPVIVPSQAPTRVVTPGEDLEPIEHQMGSPRP